MSPNSIKAKSSVKKSESKKDGSDKNLFNPYKKLRPNRKVNGEPAYELVFLLRNDMSPGDVEILLDGLKGKIKDFDGSIKVIEYWGLRNLSYKIKSMKKAHFYCVRFVGNDKLISEVHRVFSINSNIMRFIILRLQEMTTDKSHMLINLESDVSDGLVIHDAKYIFPLSE